jgi:hypothetical protein
LARNGAKGVAVVGSIIMLLCLSYSFTAAVGFTIGIRTHARNVRFLQAELNRSELTKLQASQKDLERIDETLRMPNLPASERHANEERIRELEANIRDQQTKLTLAPAVLTETSQADVLARIMGQDPELFTIGLAAWQAFIIELAGAALFFALGSSTRADKNARDMDAAFLAWVRSFTKGKPPL